MAIQTGLGFADPNEEKKKKKKLADTSKIIPVFSEEGQKLFNPPDAKPTELRKPADTSKIIPTISTEGQKLFQTAGQAKPEFSQVLPGASKPLVPTLPPKDERVAETPIQEEKVAIADVLPEQVETPEFIPTPKGTVEEGPTSEDIAASIADLKRQNMLRQRRQAFDLARGALERQLGEVPGEFREKQARVRTEDEMAREALAKRAAIGATGAGSLAQSDIAQSVITQGRVGALTEQELQAKQDIKSRMSELEIAFANDVATIENETEMAALQRQLESITAKEQAELKQAEIKDERDFQLYLRELERLDDRERLALQADIEREQTLLDAEIQKARDNRQFALETQLVDRKAANDVKLEGIRSANTQAEIAARGEQERETIGLRESFEPTPVEEGSEPRFDDKTLEQGVEAGVSALGQFASAEQKKQAAAATIIRLSRDGSIETEDQLRRLMIKYNLSDSDIEGLLE